MNNPKDILSKTGYSYSGISDIIHNEPEKTESLLHAINSEYLETKESIAKMEKELEALKLKKGLLVSSFLHAHKALKLGNTPLCFIQEDKTIVVEQLDDNKIDYLTYKLTHFTP